MRTVYVQNVQTGYHLGTIYIYEECWLPDPLSPLGRLSLIPISLTTVAVQNLCSNYACLLERHSLDVAVRGTSMEKCRMECYLVRVHCTLPWVQRLLALRNLNPTRQGSDEKKWGPRLRDTMYNQIEGKTHHEDCAHIVQYYIL